MCAPCLAKDVPSRVIIAIGFCIGHGLVDGLMLQPVWKAGGAGEIFIWVFSPIWALFTILWFWAYVRTCWIDAGSVEREMKKLRLDIRNLPPEFEEIPRCEKCHLPKTRRTHHCGQCNKCYFRFDHHCNIIGNCVGFRNLKPFLLFLFYSGLMLILLGVAAVASCLISTVIPVFVQAAMGGIAVLFSLVVIGFGCSYFPEICKNRTTLERIAGVDPSEFAGSRKEDLAQLFGKHCIQWFLPTPPSVTGFQWAGVRLSSEASKGM